MEVDGIAAELHAESVAGIAGILEFTGAGPLVTVCNELDNMITGNIGET